MMLSRDVLERALALLGELLAEQGLSFDVVAVGGGALSLQDLSSRTTVDIDIVALHHPTKLCSAQPLPQELREAVVGVAAAMDLSDDWLNAGPADLLRLGLPEGFESRLVIRRFGGLTLRLAGRRDLIATKLCAAADRGLPNKHAADLRALHPSPEELLWAARWARTQSAGEVFEGELTKILGSFDLQEGRDG